MRGYSVCITDERDLSCTPLAWFQWHDIFISSFKKIAITVQAILRLCLGNLKGCIVVINDGKDL
jgi:hypothetical protein